MERAPLEVVAGAPSWSIETGEVCAYITEIGGHVGPVTYEIPGRTIQPFSIAPWAEEEFDPEILPVLRFLRGDFFCLPFGANWNPFQGEAHPLHGETANERWTLRSLQRHQIELELALRARPGTVKKRIRLIPGHRAIYCRHEVSGMRGPMCLGHHAMLRFEEPGRISNSGFLFGMVFPDELESPEAGGYSSLKRGAMFDRLDSVPMANGETADLTKYPAREGFEDLVMLAGSKGAPFAWTAVTFNDYAWISLKVPEVLTSTLLWHSNGGRHYAPWNGRHRAVLGLEELTGYFHYGLKESVEENLAQEQGVPTYLNLDPESPLVVNTIMLVVPMSRSFAAVAEVDEVPGGLAVRSTDGEEAFAEVDVSFLFA